MGHVVDRSEVVEPVCKLDNEHPDILGHGEEHLSQVFSLTFLLALKFEGAQFGDTINEFSDLSAKIPRHVFHCVGSIFNDIVQQTRSDSLGIHSEFSKYYSNCERMDQILFS